MLFGLTFVKLAMGQLQAGSISYPITKTLVSPFKSLTIAGNENKWPSPCVNGGIYQSQLREQEMEGVDLYTSCYVRHLTPKRAANPRFSSSIAARYYSMQRSSTYNYSASRVGFDDT